MANISPELMQLVQLLQQQQPARAPPVPNYFPTTAMPQQQGQSSSSPQIPSGLLDRLTGGGSGAGTGGANTAGSVATDSGSFGASGPYDFANLSGAGGGLGDGTASGLSGGAASSGAGTVSGAGGGLAALAPFGYAAAIGVGANTEANHANTPLGDGLLAGLGPSAAQIWKDPLGMGLPTLLGAPFLTPFTASKDAKATKPEFSGLFGLGF